MPGSKVKKRAALMLVFALYTSVSILAEEEEKDEFDSVGCDLKWIKMCVHSHTCTRAHTHTPLELKGDNRLRGNSSVGVNKG